MSSFFYSLPIFICGLFFYIINLATDNNTKNTRVDSPDELYLYLLNGASIFTLFGFFISLLYFFSLNWYSLQITTLMYGIPIAALVLLIVVKCFNLARVYIKELLKNKKTTKKIKGKNLF